MIFAPSFLDALGRWQRGWGQNPTKRAPIALELAREAERLPDRYRAHAGKPLYRKRHLYRREDQRELKPLFLSGELDEGGITSWTSDLSFAKHFDGVVDEHDSKSVAGAIFRRVPAPHEVVLNIGALWQDHNFVSAAEAYRDAGGSEARALFHFRADREQSEVILATKLRIGELYLLSGFGSFDGIASELGARSEGERDAVQALLGASGQNIYEPRWLSPEGTLRVKHRVIEAEKQRTLAWMARRVPTLPAGRRGRLIDAVALAMEEGASPTQFMGWRRLPTPGGIWEARWSGGGVAYHDPRGRIWLW